MATGKKTGGRQKGTPNRATKTILQMVEDSGVNPFQVLLNLCNSADEVMAMKAASEVCQYVYPKRKSLEHSVDPRTAEAVEQISQMNKQEQIETLELEIKRLKGEV